MKKPIFLFMCIFFSIIPRMSLAETQKSPRLDDFLASVKQSKALQIIVEQTMASFVWTNTYLEANSRDKIYCLETISLNYKNFEEIMELYIKNYPQMKDFEVNQDSWRAVLLDALVERFPCK